MDRRAVEASLALLEDFARLADHLARDDAILLSDRSLVLARRWSRKAREALIGFGLKPASETGVWARVPFDPRLHQAVEGGPPPVGESVLLLTEPYAQRDGTIQARGWVRRTSEKP